MIKNRYDFMILFDVHDGNPNGDPDMTNMPRTDPDTGHGLVTDVCMKRKIRNCISGLMNGQDGFGLYIDNDMSLNAKDKAAADAVGVSLTAKKGKGESKKLSAEDAEKVKDELCRRYFDVRMFGGVFTSMAGTTCGNLRGPVQFSIARSMDPVAVLDLSLTRKAVTTDEDYNDEGKRSTFGNKYIVPYGLYRGFGFVSPRLTDKTGMTPDDLILLFKSLFSMFDLDHAAARGLMTMQKVIIFRHDGEYGRYSANDLFKGVSVHSDCDVPMMFSDYDIDVADCPDGVDARELNCLSDVDSLVGWLV